MWSPVDGPWRVPGVRDRAEGFLITPVLIAANARDGRALDLSVFVHHATAPGLWRRRVWTPSHTFTLEFTAPAWTKDSSLFPRPPLTRASSTHTSTLSIDSSAPFYFFKLSVCVFRPQIMCVFEDTEALLWHCWENLLCFEVTLVMLLMHSRQWIWVCFFSNRKRVTDEKKSSIDLTCFLWVL